MSFKEILQMHLSNRKEIQAPEPTTIMQISHPLATIWLAREKRDDASYFYGGTRLIEHNISDLEIRNALIRLMSNESSTKNRLINWSIKNGSIDELQAELPPGFLQSRVGGARCLIRPRTSEITSSLINPENLNNEAIASLLEHIGHALNEHEPRIKLTPDFGRYAGLADILHQYTPNVLGIACEKGGCGGKSSYATTGVLAAVEQIASTHIQNGPVTCIGSAGAMGSGVLQYFLTRKVADLAACDLAYDRPGAPILADGCKHLKSRTGHFTEECLVRGGVIIPTTIGDELEASSWQQIPRETILFLAHNLALPEGNGGIQLAQSLHKNGVLVIPGQVLTLGGALTARLEWYWRQIPSKPEFNKGLAHKVVRYVVSHIIVSLLNIAESDAITPYEAMLRLASEGQPFNAL